MFVLIIVNFLEEAVGLTDEDLTGYCYAHQIYGVRSHDQ